MSPGDPPRQEAGNRAGAPAGEPPSSSTTTTHAGGAWAKDFNQATSTPPNVNPRRASARLTPTGKTTTTKTPQAGKAAAAQAKTQPNQAGAPQTSAKTAVPPQAKTPQSTQAKTPRLQPGLPSLRRLRLRPRLLSPPPRRPPRQPLPSGRRPRHRKLRQRRPLGQRRTRVRGEHPYLQPGRRVLKRKRQGCQSIVP